MRVQHRIHWTIHFVLLISIPRPHIHSTYINQYYRRVALPHIYSLNYFVVVVVVIYIYMQHIQIYTASHREGWNIRPLLQPLRFVVARNIASQQHLSFHLSFRITQPCRCTHYNMHVVYTFCTAHSTPNTIAPYIPTAVVY